jgi:hypothetical protein
MARSVIEALQTRDPAALEALLAPDAVFHSPVQSYQGRELAARVLAAVGEVIDGIEVTGRFVEEGQIVSFVAGTAGGELLEGMVRELHDGGMVREVTLMVRPLAALQVAMERMRELLA